jgi:hypothetical protein
MKDPAPLAHVLDTEDYLDEHCTPQRGPTLEVERSPRGVMVRVSWSRLVVGRSVIAMFDLSRDELERMLAIASEAT